MYGSSTQYNSLDRYASSIVAEITNRVHRFMGGLGSHLINECTTTSLNLNMDFARNQAYAQNLEDRKRQQRAARKHDRGQHKRVWATGDTKESRGRFRYSIPRHSSYPVASAPQQF